MRVAGPGASGGLENVTLTVNQLPPHAHAAMRASQNLSNSGDPTGRVVANTDPLPIYNAQPPDLPAGATTDPTGDSQNHSNIMPFFP